MSKKFYLATAIAYTSSKPHIGNVYEAILADAIVRFKKKQGYDVYFQTGTDEHGQKIEIRAKQANLSPKEYVDNISEIIKDIYKSVDVEYDYFIRTTDKDHMEIVQKVFEKLYEQGDIYKGEYSGHYCIDCESYFTEKDLKEGKCPECGANVSLTTEEAYFLKLSKYQDRLVKHINDNPDFIQPESRKNEMLNNFLAAPLLDLCVSRSSYTWGIPVTFEKKHVIYVWIDALMNYITALGFDPQGNNSEKFNKYWPADVHIIGKDILRFHTIYWPIMLMALDIPLPKKVFGHPWILMNHSKMSKSKGNLIYTDKLVEIFGSDAIRYYVLHEIPFAQDGNLTYELVHEKYNSDLVNTLGNLVNRTIAMVHKYFKGSVEYHGIILPVDQEIEDLCLKTKNMVFEAMEVLKVPEATELIMKLLRRANKYVDETEPWILARDESKSTTLENVLFHLLETIRFAGVLLECFIPNNAKNIYKQLNTTNTSYDSLEFAIEKKYYINEGFVLFKRLDLEKDVLGHLDNIEEPEEPKKPEITIDDFDKVELVVGQILEARKHPKADKLLVFKVDIKTETRQIVSGIAKYYKPEDLIGKKVVVVKNLKSISLRGEESCGMLLCASDEDSLELLNVSDLKPGDKVS